MEFHSIFSMHRILAFTVILNLVAQFCIAQNVGIGTTLPQEQLHTGAWIRSDSLSGADSAILMTDNDGTLKRFPHPGDSGQVLLGNLTWGAMPGSGSSGALGNFSYPDGFNGITPVVYSSLSSVSVTIPAGQNLYISQLYSGSANTVFQVDGKTVYRGFSGFGSAGRDQHLEQPIIVGAGQVISVSGGSIHANGFLIDSTVAPMTFNNLSSVPYTVPSGKVFVILNYHSLSSSAALNVDGARMYFGFSNWGDATNQYNNLGDVLFVGPGMVLSATQDGVVVNGYLREP